MKVLMLTPSVGCGGGIERYAETVEWVFRSQGVACRRLDLARSGLHAHARLVGQTRSVLKGSGHSTRLVLLHRALLPAASLVARDRAVDGISVICHGSDAWAGGTGPRRKLEERLMQRSDVRVLAVSSFTSGALSRICRSGVLPPGLSGGWYESLVAAADHALPGRRSTEVHLATAFRLGSWREKGLPELLAAVAALGRPDVKLTVFGSGEPTAELMRMVRRYRWCTVKPNLDDRQLAYELARADLFVLATRTRRGSRASGEGFGIVLLEAQVAGTPVVGPAYGGSHEAFAEGVTGRAPADETAEALAAVLQEVLQDSDRLERMGKQAAEWARAYFSPQQYARRVVAQLL